MAKNVFLTREEHRESPEVHVAGSCFKETAPDQLEILFAKRSLKRQLYPGKFEGCGGQLRYGESFTQGVVRHFLQELNITVQPLKDVFTTYEIKLDTGVIPGIRYLCKYISGPPTLVNHTDLIWLSENNLRTANPEDFVGNLKNDLLNLIELYRIAKAIDVIKQSKIKVKG